MNEVSVIVIRTRVCKQCQAPIPSRKNTNAEYCSGQCYRQSPKSRAVHHAARRRYRKTEKSRIVECRYNQTEKRRAANCKRVKKRLRHYHHFMYAYKSYFGCVDCGLNPPVNKIHLHHLDPSTKDFSIAQGWAHSFLDVLAELEKCVCLCACCHQKRHNVLKLAA